MLLLPLILLLPLSALPGCEQEPANRILKDETSESFRIKTAMQGWAADLEQGQIQALLAQMDPAFLHQGDDLTALEEWSRFWLTAAGRLEVSIERMDVAIERGYGSATLPEAEEGALAEVSYTLRIESCDEARLSCAPLLVQRALPGTAQAWLGHFRKQDGVWWPVGDGKPFGVELTSWREGGQTLLQLVLRDPRRRLIGGRVAGHALPAGGMALSRRISGDWGLGEVVELAADPAGLPRFPLTYRFTLQTAEGELVQEAELQGVVNEFATLLAPNGEAIEPVSFFWRVEGELQHRFQVQVLEDGRLLWVSPVLYTTETIYAGPVLRAGQEYGYAVLVLDSWGNASVNRSSLVPLPSGELTPVIGALSSAMGPAAGGQSLSITGAGFQPGARVLFDTVEAEEAEVVQPSQIRCTTPAADPGPANVLVVNPSGRVGLLERGYSFELD